MIYINDHEADLSPKTSVAITYQGFDVGQIKSRFLSHTNNIDLPDTKNNSVILGYADQEASGSNAPYETLDVRVVEGVELISGKGFLTQYSNGYKLRVFDDIVDFFDIIRDKKISDLRYLPNTAWTPAHIESIRLNRGKWLNGTTAEGVLAPVVNYGKVVSTGLDLNFYLPSCSYLDWVNEIVSAAGFGITGNIFDDTFHNDLLHRLTIPFARDKFEYTELYSEERSFEATATSVQSLDTSAQTVVIQYTETIYNGVLDWYDDSIWKWVVPNFGSSGAIGKIRLTLNVTYTSDGIASPGPGDLITIRLKDTASTLLEEFNVMPDTVAGTFEVALDGIFDFSSESEIYAEIQSTGGPNIDIDFVNLKGEVQLTPVVNFLFHDYLLPDVLQEDIIKDFLVRFCLVPKISNGVIDFKTLQSVIEEKSNALDLSGELIKKSSIDFFYKDYNQRNLFTYTDLAETGVGEGVLTYNNDNANREQVYFESVFGNSATAILGSTTVRCVSIPVYDSTSSDIYDFKNEPGLRLFRSIPQDQIGGIPGLMRYNTLIATYLVGIFETYNTGQISEWQLYINRYYAGLQTAFELPKSLTKSFRLSVVSFARLDPHKLIWDGEGYYILTRVNNFVPGNEVELEMFKVI